MPITRRALLISNPGEDGQENYCRGVYVDVKNYQQLLLSPEGGAWEAGEIIQLDRPNIATVRFWIGDCSMHDYSFVMFTGHGWFSSVDKDRVLELRKGEAIASNELLTDTNKRTVILDCCQKVHEVSLLEKRARMLTAMANEAQRRRTPNRDNCKRLFLNSIVAAERGFVRMCSCQIGEVSRDDDATGGYYNSSLIDCADDWAAQQAKSQWGGDAILSVVEVHEPAAAITRRRSAGLQNPTIEKARTGPYFPISVFG
jgi:hypothetical protein